jgi:hypothetical protein
MKIIFNIKLFGRKLILQRDNNGSYTLGLIKEDPLPRIGRKALEELDNNLSDDQEKVRKLIDPLYSRDRYNANDIRVTAIQNMAKVAATAPAEDITEPLEPLSEERKEYWQAWVKEREEKLKRNREELEHIINKQTA